MVLSMEQGSGELGLGQRAAWWGSRGGPGAGAASGLCLLELALPSQEAHSSPPPPQQLQCALPCWGLWGSPSPRASACALIPSTTPRCLHPCPGMCLGPGWHACMLLLVPGLPVRDGEAPGPGQCFPPQATGRVCACPTPSPTLGPVPAWLLPRRGVSARGEMAASLSALIRRQSWQPRGARPVSSEPGAVLPPSPWSTGTPGCRSGLTCPPGSASAARAWGEAGRSPWLWGACSRARLGGSGTWAAQPGPTQVLWCQTCEVPSCPSALPPCPVHPPPPSRSLLSALQPGLGVEQGWEAHPSTTGFHDSEIPTCPRAAPGLP